jgi:hypothetical protein
MVILLESRPCLCMRFIKLEGVRMQDFLLTMGYHIIFLLERIFRSICGLRFKSPDISRMTSLKGFRREY